MPEYLLGMFYQKGGDKCTASIKEKEYGEKKKVYQELLEKEKEKDPESYGYY